MWGRGDAGGDHDEKQGLLSPIVDRTSANYNEEGIKAAEALEPNGSARTTVYKIQLETLSPTGTKIVLVLTYATFALALILGISGVSSKKVTKILSAAPCSSALAAPGVGVYTGGFGGVDEPPGRAQRAGSRASVSERPSKPSS